jgi:integrase
MIAEGMSILTAARSGEVRGAGWEEIDRSTATWTIPAERMKMRREHRVPLSGGALAVLNEAEALRDASGLVFPSVRGIQLSDMTLSKLVRELGIKSTVHGFRSSFRTWAQEQTTVPGEIAEAALAHVKADKVEAAYARSDLLEKRRNLMESWAEFISE